MKRVLSISLALSIICILLPSFVFAADTVLVGVVLGLSGFNAPASLRVERGVLMAAEEINAAGGILGKKIETFTLDSKSDPPFSVSAMKKAVERNPFVIFGTNDSGSTIANMSVLQEAGIPQFSSSEAPAITQKGNLNIFRASLNTELNLQKLLKWITEVLKTQKMAIVYTNTEYGRGGRDAMVKLLTPKGVKIVADVVGDTGQTDFTGELVRVKSSGADTLYVILIEEEAGRILPQIREMGLDRSMKIIGAVSVLTETAIKLAKESANGLQGQMDFSPVAPPFKPTADKYQKIYQETPDHNFFKGYISFQIFNAAMKEIKVFDQQKLRDFLHNRTLCVKNHPGIRMDVHFDEKGDLDRESWLIKVENQKHVITGILDPLHPEWFGQCKK